jgi:hypothetical protein
MRRRIRRAAQARRHGALQILIIFLSSAELTFGCWNSANEEFLLWPLQTKLPANAARSTRAEKKWPPVSPGALHCFFESNITGSLLDFPYAPFPPSFWAFLFLCTAQEKHFARAARCSGPRPRHSKE